MRLIQMLKAVMLKPKVETQLLLLFSFLLLSEVSEEPFIARLKKKCALLKKTRRVANSKA